MWKAFETILLKNGTNTGHVGTDAKQCYELPVKNVQVWTSRVVIETFMFYASMCSSSEEGISVRCFDYERLIYGHYRVF